MYAAGVAALAYTDSFPGASGVGWGGNGER